MSLEKYAKQNLTRHDSIGWAAAQYLEALAHLRREMLIGDEVVDPCPECGSEYDECRECDE